MKLSALILALLFCAPCWADIWDVPISTIINVINSDHKLKSPNITTGKVTKVHGGDSIWVEDSMGTRYKVRLKGIDAPELKQAYGNESQKALAKMTLNKDVVVGWDSKDRYGRVLGIVFLLFSRKKQEELLRKTEGYDPKNHAYWEDQVYYFNDINFDMLRHDHAWHYKQYSKDQTYAKAQKDAKKAKKGLWAQESPIAPWEWRKKNRKADQFKALTRSTIP